MATQTKTFHSSPSKPRPTSLRRKKDQPRTEIWSNLLRQTREAQARSRTQALQNRQIILCGGKPEDQRSFVERYVARPPPPAPPVSSGRRDGGAKEGRRGEVRLSNRFAYGYGHVTLFSPPQQGSAGAGLLGGEAEEVARVECHCLPGKAEGGYEGTLRRLLRPRREQDQNFAAEADAMAIEGEEEEGRRPSVVILMSWKEPWTFLSSLRAWLSLLARALLPPQARQDENPIEVLTEHHLALAVVLQHVEAQEDLERENYKEESFDYISQNLRTCLLPLNAALIYTPTTPAPTQPGGPLSEVQKALYSSLSLDVAALQTRRPGSAGAGAQAKKGEFAPKHNVVDRMAILVPSGWDSVGKIRLLSETFSPEATLEGWLADLDKSSALLFAQKAVAAAEADQTGEDGGTAAEAEEDPTPLQAHGTGTGTGPRVSDIYSSQPSPTNDDSLLDDNDRPPSPSKQPKSAITPYETLIQDPHAHKIPPPPRLEVTTKPNQEFLAEMRAQLQQYEAQDAERARKDAGAVSNNTAGALTTNNPSTRGATADRGGGALEELGDVSFNVGGVSYNTVSAEAAIERLKKQRPAQLSSSGELPASSSSSRTGMPKPVRREREASGKEGGELQTDKLEEYFASLMKRGGGGSREGTPSRGS